jgi:hypothetical protein
MMEKAVIEVIAMLAILVVLSFLFSWPVMALWNGCLVDAVSGVKEITWLQAWGLSVLCNLLFSKTISK